MYHLKHPPAGTKSHHRFEHFPILRRRQFMKFQALHQDRRHTRHRNAIKWKWTLKTSASRIEGEETYKVSEYLSGSWAN
jgi:hypothetical protein